MKSNNRLSVPVHNQYYPTDFNVDMFTEDLAHYIVPFSDDEISCSIIPANQQLESALLGILAGFSQYGRSGLEDAVLDSIRYIAGLLVQEGFVIFEFVTMVEDDETFSYRLVPVLGSVKIEDQSVTQIINARQTGTDSPEQKIIIPRQKCLIFHFPESLGGEKEYKEFMEKFRRDSKSVPMMRMFSAESLMGAKGYDLTKHQRMAELRLWKRTQLFGWNHRDYSNKHFSSYYSVYRSLKFKRSKVLLCDYVISALLEVMDF